MVSLEQKEKNKKYILDNLEEYIIDSRGNFVNTNDEKFCSDYFVFYPDSLTSEGYQKVYREVYRKVKNKPRKIDEEREKIKLGESILADLDNRELSYRLKGFRNKQTGREVDLFDCHFTTYYEIVGELGYSFNIWKKYDNNKEYLERLRKEREWIKLIKSPSSQSSHENNPPFSEHNPQSEINQNINIPSVTQPTPNSVKQVSIQPKNNSLPSADQIQQHFDQDKDRKLVTNKFTFSPSAICKSE
jgi:hypothetical protein